MPPSGIKSLASRLPESTQLSIRRWLYARQIRRGAFRTTEPEYGRLSEWIRSGDWVVDVGANIGHYTCRFSELAGAAGRVIAFEPVPATFSILAANARHFAHDNVTLVNAAASSSVAVQGMTIPDFSTGLRNYYEAQLTDSPRTPAATSVLTLPVDALSLPGPVSLVKIDAEGHEAQVLDGMRNLLRTRHPVLIVETGDEAVVRSLRDLGYASERLPGSPNILFRP